MKQTRALRPHLDVLIAHWRETVARWARMGGPWCLGLCVSLPPSCSSGLTAQLCHIRSWYQLGSCNGPVREGDLAK